MENFTYFTQLEGKTIGRVEVLTPTGNSPYDGVRLHCTDGTQIEIGADSLGLKIDDGSQYEAGYDEGKEDGLEQGKDEGYDEGKEDGLEQGRSDRDEEIIAMIKYG